MTVEEFQSWLEGYVEAGGTDVERIRQQARDIWVAPITVPANPTLPPVDWQPLTAPDQPPWYSPVTCDSTDVTYS